MQGEVGLLVELEPTTSTVGMEASYLHGDDIVSVRVEPFARAVVSYVRTESVHFDIDESGYPVAIEILGPPVSAWRRRPSLSPPASEDARLRFVAREQETGPEAAFETDEKAAILRIILTPRAAIRHVTVAKGLVVLVELWITEFVTVPGEGI